MVCFFDLVVVVIVVVGVVFVKGRFCDICNCGNGSGGGTADGCGGCVVASVRCL